MPTTTDETSGEYGTSLAAASINHVVEPTEADVAQPPTATQATATADIMDHEATQMTCDVLCALSGTTTGATNTKNQQRARAALSSYAQPEDYDEEGGGRGVMAPPYHDHHHHLGARAECPVAECQLEPIYSSDDSKSDSNKQCGMSKACPKQLQLPMFLSKTYHMINRADPEIACWSESGDSFVIKNVEHFASRVLPLYFKHSNFSSFARQLNFYGFRKLRTDPILTSEVDPHTACFVRFYHEKFHKDRPELLHQIKRATKTDQQSKDDVESLKHEVARLKDALAYTTTEYDRKLAELSYECNRRITAMNAEYDRLLSLVQQSLAASAASTATGPPGSGGLLPGTAGTAGGAPAPLHVPDLLHSLSQAAVSLQSHLRNTAVAHHHGNTSPSVTINNAKRPGGSDSTSRKNGSSAGKKARNQ